MIKKVFTVEINLQATAYIIATSEEDAVEKIKGFNLQSAELPTGDFMEGLPVSGARIDSPDLPDVSISPAVTVYVDDPTAFHLEDLTRFVVEGLDDNHTYRPDAEGAPFRIFDIVAQDHLLYPYLTREEAEDALKNYLAGMSAATAGIMWWNNPHPSGSAAAYQWDAGHQSNRRNEARPASA